MESTSIPLVVAVRRGSSLVQTLQRPTSVLAAGHFLAMPRWQHLEMDQVTYEILWMEEILHQLVDGTNPIVIQL